MDKVSIFSHTAYTDNGNPYQKTNMGKIIGAGSGILVSGSLCLMFKNHAKDHINKTQKKYPTEIARQNYRRGAYITYFAMLAVISYAIFLIGDLIGGIVNKSRRNSADNPDDYTDDNVDNDADTYDEQVGLDDNPTSQWFVH